MSDERDEKAGTAEPDETHQPDGRSDTVPEGAEGGHQQQTDVRDTQPGNRDTGDHPGMGVSSERVGVAGPGQVGTEGVRDTDDEARAEAGTDTESVDTVETPDGEPVVREQRRGLPETNPDPVEGQPHDKKRNPGHTHG